ncbi:alpha-glucosidase [Francisella sp. Scap27]|uniref:glycoside hydrolase family 31 protein n=1 Tax=Francisella sp. Scap27 TaxID=2589986 RepID=UPI0015B8342B|nr:TIM-barrel domain-containing protein [Francisella sp. Scap27]QLE78927.1 alpha-glucosidase [Francisella sp. Scap27]
MLNICTFRLKEVRENSVELELVEKAIFVKVFVLEENIFRVLFTKSNKLELAKTWSITRGDIPFEGVDRLDTSSFSCPDFNVDLDDGLLTIETNELRAEIKLQGLHFTWYKKDLKNWVKISEDLNTQAYNLGFWSDRGAYHAIKKDPDWRFFGLGEKAGELNRDKKRYEMKSIDPMGYDAESSDPLYKHIPFFITHNSKQKTSFGLFYDNLSDSAFNFGKEIDNYHGPYISYEAKAGDLDYYFIAGEKIAEVTETFSRITGKTILPPYWSLYYSGSTMTYTDLPDAQHQMSNFIDDCQQYNIQCGSFQLSSGYTSIGDKRYVFNWNDTKFPDVSKFTKHYSDNGIKLCANIKPCLLQDHPKLGEIKSFNGLINNEQYKQPELVQFWDELGYYLDFTNPKTIDWWQDNVTKQLLEKGIESTWNDNNEFEVYNGEASCNGFGNKISIKHIKPVQALLMTKASYEAQLKFTPNKRPYLITRSGCAGLQRYAQTWTGDNRTEWKTLKYNLEMAKGLSLSGIYNFGHDIGGFSGPAPDLELFVRWVQHGIFYPRFTIHSWNDDESVNTPWMHLKGLPIIQKAFSLRNEIIPYIYQLCYQAHANAKPIIKPTFYDFEEDEKTFEANQDFMVGDLLIANILEKDAKIREVYLPKDSHWYDYYTGEVFAGGQTIKVDVSLESILVFVREGAVISINKLTAGFNNFEKDIAYKIYPSLSESITTHNIYIDDGKTNEYLDGENGILLIEVANNDGMLEVEWHYKGCDKFKVLDLETINMNKDLKYNV